MSDYQGADGWDTVQAGLAAVVTDHGRRISEDAGRLRAALSDQLGAAGHTYRSLADAVIVAAEEHIPADLIAGASGQPARTYAELLAALTARGFAQPLAATVIERWRAVLAGQRSGPPLVPPVVPPLPPAIVQPVPPPPVPTVAVNDASAPTHLAGQGAGQGAGPASTPTPGTPTPSRRYAVLLVVCLVLVAAVGSLIWFQHRGSDTAGPGTPSSSGSPRGALTAPQSLSASTGAGTISLTWQSVDGATRYVVTRDGTTVSTSNQTTTLFTDTVSDTSQHTYTVVAMGTDGPGPAATVTATADAVIPSTGPSSTAETSAEAALVATLPTTAVDTSTCKPYPNGEDENADASVTCSSVGTDGNPPTTIFAYHYVSLEAQQKATASSVSYEHLATGGCTGNTPGATTWHLDSAPTDILGALLCYNDAPEHVVRWDYGPGQVSIEGWTADGTLAGVLTWWEKSVGPLR